MTVAVWNTGTFPTDLAKKSFAAMITRLFPNGQAPLYGISSMLKEETAYQPEHGYFSKTMIFPSVQLNGAVASGAATNFVVDSTANIVPGMVLQSEGTPENVLVTAVVDATNLTVVRGFGTVAGAAIADNVVLYLVGNAYEEASTRPQSLLIVPTRVINYTQIFRNTWLASGTAIATQVIAGGSVDAENRQDCAMFHAGDIEKALIWGQLKSSTKTNSYGTMPIRTMNGLINYVTVDASGNVTTLGSTTNWTQLEAALDPVFAQNTDPKGAPERVMFVGGIARRVIHNVCRLNSQYQITDQQTSWGLQFDSFRTPRGRFNLVEHPLLNAFGSSASWSKMAIVVDLPTFGMAYMTGRKTQSREFNMSGQPVDAGVDAVGGTLTTECTCLVKNSAANAVLYNFTAAAAG
ncbi:MAG: hypothetical protein E6R04_10600 [Spirochaetes bacterium]|nr:MAG: hypothetical protein E6R04_10600 [Spirochaetota bacterium]